MCKFSERPNHRVYVFFFFGRYLYIFYKFTYRPGVANWRTTNTYFSHPDGPLIINNITLFLRFYGLVTNKNIYRYCGSGMYTRLRHRA